MNYYHLQLEVNERSLQFDFLDITITIISNRCISTKLYEKAIHLRELEIQANRQASSGGTIQGTLTCSPQ
jgi:hypothetical protein